MIARVVIVSLPFDDLWQPSKLASHGLFVSLPGPSSCEFSGTLAVGFPVSCLASSESVPGRRNAP